jgi:hypothetical protein
MATLLRKAVKSADKSRRQTAIERMEAAAPSGEKLRQLVKKNSAPQQWYDEDETSVKAAKRKR